MYNLFYSNNTYRIFKQYNLENKIYARAIFETNDLKLAYKKLKLLEEIPVNNVSSGHIAGTDLGLVKKKKKHGYYFRNNKST